MSKDDVLEYTGTMFCCLASMVYFAWFADESALFVATLINMAAGLFIMARLIEHKE